MMAQNLAAHALSPLTCRSSPYLSQDHMISSRHMPILSVPDILEAFHQTHPSSGTANVSNNSMLRSASIHTDPWELPELKWLDPAENCVVGSSDNPAEPPGRFVVQSMTNLVPVEKFGLDGGERSWPFSELYAGDPVAVNGVSAAVGDSLSQFSLQSMVTASPASSGSSMLRTKPRVSSTVNVSFASRDFPTSAGSTPPDWCTDTAVTNTPSCSSGSHKRPALSDRPESDLTQEMSNSGRSDFKVDAENFVPDRLVSNKRGSPSTTISFPAEKRKRPSQDGGAVAARNHSSLTGPNKKATVEKSSVSNSAVTKQQSRSPGRETGSKKPAASVAAAAVSATVSDHEIHIWTERERRKKMNGMFTTLHSLLPHLTSKADKSTIVDEAINYIQSLEVTMKGMLKRKCEMANSSSSMLPSSLVLSLQASKHGPGSSMTAVEMDKISAADNMSVCGLNVKAGSLNSVGSTGDSHHTFQTLCSPNIVLNICGIDAFITICSPRGMSGLLCRVLFVMESHRLHVVNAHISTTEDTNLLMLHAQSVDRLQLSNHDRLNITLQDLTNCLGTAK